MHVKAESVEAVTLTNAAKKDAKDAAKAATGPAETIKVSVKDAASGEPVFVLNGKKNVNASGKVPSSDAEPVQLPQPSAIKGVDGFSNVEASAPQDQHHRHPEQAIEGGLKVTHDVYSEKEFNLRPFAPVATEKLHDRYGAKKHEEPLFSLLYRQGEVEKSHLWL